jgi:hypothetical protein
MSLIGAAIAGGLQGGGEAAKVSLGSMQDAVQKEELTRLANELDEQKQMRIQANNQQFLSAQAGEDRKFRTSERLGTETFTATQQKDRFAHEADQGDKERTSRKEISAASNATQIRSSQISAGAHLQAARMQLEKPVLQQGADGTFTALSFKIQPDGSYRQVATQVLGADNKPLVGKRDLTDRDKLELTNLQGQLLEKKKAIDKARTEGTATPELVKKLADEGDAIQVRYNKTAGIPAWELTQDDPRTVLSEALKSKASPEVMQKLIAGGESKYGPAWKAQFDYLMRQTTPTGEAAKPAAAAPVKKDPLAAAIESKLPVNNGLLGKTMSDYSTQQFPRFDDIVNRK